MVETRRCNPWEQPVIIEIAKKLDMDPIDYWLEIGATKVTAGAIAETALGFGDQIFSPGSLSPQSFSGFSKEETEKEF